MASPTKIHKIRRKRKQRRMGHNRKKVLAVKSTPSAEELFGSAQPSA